MNTALYLLPVGLSDARPEDVIPSGGIEILKTLRYFVVENLRTARRWIKRCDPGFSFEGVEIVELNEHTSPGEVYAMLEPLRNGHSVGVMSEAGCPAVADPGADIVAIAQRERLKVVPLAGPSSILMSLMASGFNGQSFCFHGYLPVDDKEKRQMLLRLERESERENRTQIFIETPYRNNRLLQLMTDTLAPDTRICVASEITDSEKESILTKTVAEWRKSEFDYGKKPTIFLLYRGNTLRASRSIHGRGDKKGYKKR